MEAMSAGIPVFATNVGGTKEIVNSDNGTLLPANIDPDFLAEQITNYYHLNRNTKIELSNNSHKKYKQLCDAEKLAEKLAVYLNLI
jgi:glycosyltransferase involved in cell wall biosynthesis